MIILEQLIFNIIAFTLFVIIFFKIIQRNDTSYVISLVIEAIGIVLSFFQLVLNQNFNIVIKTIIYAMAIVLPALIIILEKGNILFIEIISIISAKKNVLLGKNKLAKRRLSKLVTLYPQSYIGHKLLAQIYEKEGGVRKALDEYIQLVDIKKTDYKSYYKVAEILNSLDKKEESAEMLNKLLQKQPQNVEATKLLGEILIEQEKYKEAVYIYLDGLKFNPTDYDMNYNLGIVYTLLNDFQNAKMYYEKSAFLNSLEYNSQYSLAEIALIFKELEEAERYFLETSQCEELEADSYFELARISIMKAEKDRAINYANLAIESNPKKIVEKIKNDSLFITIMTKINIPLNLENIEEKESKLGQKELKVKKHLEDTFEITRHLGYNHIRMNKKEERIDEKAQDSEQEKIDESIEREEN
ncbi:MAG: tetratricopeptide repeat protein [Clostridia bacterium]|nr:tetratricopeptide repeat protein [Clostridia bacterium]